MFARSVLESVTDKPISFEVFSDELPSVVSVFAGRIADTGVDPIPAMKESLSLLEGPATPSTCLVVRMAVTLSLKILLDKSGRWLDNSLAARELVGTDQRNRQGSLHVVIESPCLWVPSLFVKPDAVSFTETFHLTIAGRTLLLIAAPVWLTFLDALQKAHVPFKEAARAYQIQPGLLIGLFDDIFYTAFNSGWLVTNPSANFIVLLGCLLSLVYLRRLTHDRIFVGVALSALCSLALVFGMVPAT